MPSNVSCSLPNKPLVPTRKGDATFACGLCAALGSKCMRAVAIICCLLLAACVRMPSVSQPEAAGLEAVADALLESASSSESVSTAWPEQIRVLGPKAVRVTPDGLYVVTSSWFVEEVGFFVPRDPDAFSPVAGGDPEYRRLHGHVFSYRIRG